MSAFALHLEKFGSPTEEGVITLNKIDKPKPGPGQVVVAVKYACLHPSDMFTLKGEYPGAKVVQNRGPFPSPAGSEGAGIVVSVGEGVEHLKVGQRVMPTGGVGCGMWTTHFVSEAARTVPIPDGISLEKAAQAVINPITVLGMFHDLGIQKDEFYIVNAANSTLGRISLDVARARGYKAICIVRRDAVVEELKKQGAHTVIVNTKEDVVAKIMEVTEGKGAKYFIDAVGGEESARIIKKAVSSGGTCMVYGAQAGQPTPLDYLPLIFTDVTIKGFWLTTYFARQPDNIPKLIGESFELMLKGEMDPKVDVTFGLHEYAKALKEQWEGSTGRLGKIMFEMEKTEGYEQ